ncbi:MAG: rod shape-determining protein RodA [Deltaproteobacteria bacterium]|nr:rod shape-determining protein RodA [Deltaproteobacteria bacterium]
MRITRSSIHWPLVAVVTFVAGVGLVNLYSALHQWGAGGHARLFGMQCVWMGLGAALAALLARYDYRLLQRTLKYWVVITLVLLVLVIFAGRSVGGNRNWIGIAGFGIQPSELAKLVLVAAFAKFFTDFANPRGYHLLQVARPIGIALLMTGAIVLGGDMGTTLFLVVLCGSMLVIGGLRWRSVVLIIGIGTVAAVGAYQLVFTKAQRARVATFLDPEADPRGAGYHVIQSKTAIGSGMVFGRGYRRGTVNKLRYLPEQHTDFVFPVLAEEWGFLGCAAIVTAYLLLLTFGLEIARDAGDRFGSLFAAGIVLYLFWQIAVNLGGVVGLLPMTGVTLPFLSYGGSSLLTTFIAIGFLLAIHRRRYLF